MPKKKIEYKKGEEVGPYHCQFVKEIASEDPKHRWGLFLCGTCKTQFFEACIDRVKSGNKKSCGCARTKDLTGKRFGALTVLKRNGSKRYNGSTKSLWTCVCDCGKEKDICGSSLISGKTKSCGCLKKEAGNRQVKDLTGKRFGLLTVLKRNGSKRYSDGSIRSLWTCKCDCGKEKDICSKDLISGKTISCGCRKISKGELKIKELLSELKIKYIYEYKIADSRQRFDFFLPDVNIAIEYDGTQHFEPVDFFGGEEGFEKTKERDRKKNEYCQKNNIKLIRIPYTDFNKLNVDYISNLLKIS